MPEPGPEVQSEVLGYALSYIPEEKVPAFIQRLSVAEGIAIGISAAERAARKCWFESGSDYAYRRVKEIGREAQATTLKHAVAHMGKDDVGAFIEGLCFDKELGVGISAAGEDFQKHWFETNHDCLCSLVVSTMSKEAQATAFYVMDDVKRFEVLNWLGPGSFLEAIESMESEGRRRLKKNPGKIDDKVIMTDSIKQQLPESALWCVYEGKGRTYSWYPPAYRQGRSMMPADCGIHTYHEGCNSEPGAECPVCRYPGSQSSSSYTGPSLF